MPILPQGGIGKTRKTMKKILFVASEANPYAGTGGLGDVMGSLPAAIAALSSLANFVLSCIITKSENESISVCDSFYVLSLVVLYYGYRC